MYMLFKTKFMPLAIALAFAAGAHAQEVIKIGTSPLSQARRPTSARTMKMAPKWRWKN
jgi:hypothetical protein